ncbi:MAG TPA: hypothetical protein VM802_01495, partial [Chitinophaga sp.]|nr:hypothetical protein [Chitinophaga sp.]
SYFWHIVTGSGLAADTVLKTEKALSGHTPPSLRYAYENRNGKLVRTYSDAYTRAYHAAMGDMVERRMKNAIEAVAACWYTAWVNAGQPSLQSLVNTTPSDNALQEFRQLQQRWLQGRILGRDE